MAKVTAIGTFSWQAATAGKDFRLEQKPWPKKNPAKFSDWLKEWNLNPTGGNLISAWEQYKSSCTDDGDLCPTLRVRLADIATPYVLRASYGSLAPSGKLVTESRREYLAFELDTEKPIDFGEIISWSWNGDVYDEQGNIIATSPPVTISGKRLAKTGVPVYGVLEVEVSEQLWEHILTISPRTPTAEQTASDDSIYDELYASTAMLFCGGRIQLHDVNMPDDYGACAGGFSGQTESPDDPQNPVKKNYAVTFEAFDYCNGEPLVDAKFTVTGKDIEPRTYAVGDTAILPSGDYDISVSADGYTPSDEDDLSDNDTFTLSEAANG